MASTEKLATDIWSLVTLFAHAKTFGSLIQIPKVLEDGLPSLEDGMARAIENGDVFAKAAAQDLVPLVQQAKILAMKFDAVVANPPYMGSKGMNAALKDYAKATFPDSKSDLFAMFIERGFCWCKSTGFNSMVTMQSWMFLSSYEAMRQKLLQQRTLFCMVHMGNGVMGIAFGTAATVMLNKHVSDYAGSFSYCENDDIGENERPKEFPVQNERLKVSKPDDFKKIPGSPLAYWVSKKVISTFVETKSIDQFSTFKQGMATSDNERFLRLWHEVNFSTADLNCQNADDLQRSPQKWFPYNKGGSYRKWYGNNEFFVNWQSDDKEMKAFTATLPQGTWVRLKSREYYCLPNITYSGLSSGDFGCRLSDPGFLFDTKGSCIFAESQDQLFELSALLNSKVCQLFLNILCPTLDYSMVGVKKLPTLIVKETVEAARKAQSIAKSDWDSSEISWGFLVMDLCLRNHDRLEAAWNSWATKCESNLAKLKNLEEENNRLFIEAYDLQDELTPEVQEDKITLTRADREKDSQRLISYAIGCMMGRYSLDEPGLIYAHAGNVGFDATRYQTFSADADGIIPITDELWFEDDAANRIREFLLAVWPEESVVSDQWLVTSEEETIATEKLATSHSSLATNMQWLAESLGTKGNETPAETIRRYLASSFYKDHLQTYKKRPIYWLFSSGKQGAFQALVYLHRYHEGTLARMRAEYVVPLTGKMQSRIEMLEKDKDAASSTAARNKITKQIESLKKKHVELLAYDEKLRHYADMRISLDLDDGVKVNYGKFGDLLAEVKAVTGGTADD